MIAAIAHRNTINLVLGLFDKGENIMHSTVINAPATALLDALVMSLLFIVDRSRVEDK